MAVIGVRPSLSHLLEWTLSKDGLIDMDEVDEGYSYLIQPPEKLRLDYEADFESDEEAGPPLVAGKAREGRVVPAFSARL